MNTKLNQTRWFSAKRITFSSSFLVLIATCSIALWSCKAHEEVMQKTPSGLFKKLIWAEEFTTAGLPDPKNWDYEEGFVRNKEKQYFP